MSYGNESEKFLPLTEDLTVLFLDKWEQVCHFLALHGKILGYPRAFLLNNRAEEAFPAFTQLLNVEKLDSIDLIFSCKFD